MDHEGQRPWGKQVGSSSQVEHRVTYDPAIPLLGIYPRDMKTYVHMKTCT